MPTASETGPIVLAVLATLLFVGTAALAVWALVMARDARRALELERIQNEKNIVGLRNDVSVVVKGIEESAKIREAELLKKIEAQTTDVTRCLTLVTAIGDMVADGDPKKRVRVEAAHLVARRGATPGFPRKSPVMKDGARVQLSDSQLWALECKKRGWKDEDGLELDGEDRSDAETLATTAEKVLEEARA